MTVPRRRAAGTMEDSPRDRGPNPYTIFLLRFKMSIPPTSTSE